MFNCQHLVRLNQILVVAFVRHLGSALNQALHCKDAHLEVRGHRYAAWCPTPGTAVRLTALRLLNELLPSAIAGFAPN